MISPNEFYDQHRVKTWHLVDYQGSASWAEFNWDMMPDREYLEAIRFCHENIKGNWFKNLRSFWFEDSSDAIVFKLKYG